MSHVLKVPVMSETPMRWTADALLSCCRTAYFDERLAAPGGDGYALLDLDRVVDSATREELMPLLSLLPCPVIAFGNADSLLAAHADVHVGSFAEAMLLSSKITRAPGAALVLVQLLRALPAMSLERALEIESLAYATLQGGVEHRAWLGTRDVCKTPVGGLSDPLVLTRCGDHLEIRLNRPAGNNAISLALRDALVESLQLVASDNTIRTCVLAGNGKCFSVGGELEEFGGTPDTLSAHLVRTARSPARWLARSSTRIHARLHGACIGAGIELPAFAARVVARRDAFFQLPELKMGLIPGAGGCVSIPRRIGRQRCAWLVLSGRRINAMQALAWGLVDEVVEEL